MASIHIREIFQELARRGAKDASPFDSKGEGFFVEIDFQDEQHTRIAMAAHAIDSEYANKVLSVETGFGTALILFDEAGLLKSIELC
ncbi:hypothetical protein [Deinococcus fonticola]|uniref:hypothetical protein n=1 Tax=Deinococcus fonticola TaxID=2528713 RepID=UPI0010753FD6|nr:hypothetical protein [Deinococcus fonticola]